MKEISLAEYTNIPKIKCDTLLTPINWSRLLNSNDNILETLVEYSGHNLIVKISVIRHSDSVLRTPLEKGFNDYYYDSNTKMYVTYEMYINRDLNTYEKRKYGKSCTGVSKNLELPLSMWFTVLRAKIQQKKIEENRCNCNRCKCKNM